MNIVSLRTLFEQIKYILFANAEANVRTNYHVPN
jgi:hypothetical protein